MSRRQQYQQPQQQQGNRNRNRQQAGGRFQNEQQGSRSQWERQQHGPTESFDARGGRYSGGHQHGRDFGDFGRQQDWQSRGQGHQGQQDDWARSNQWDEDRYGYPEATSYGREMSRGESGYGGRGRFGQGDDDQGSGYRQHSGGGYGDYGDGGRMAGSGSGSGFGSSSGSYGSGYGIPAGGDSRQQWGGGYSEQTRSRQDMSAGNQQRPGGKTPKGYVRSDDRIKDDICERLYHSHDMDVAGVTVNVSEGVVILEGSVSERQQKHRIEDICEQCIGVKDVENRIRVSRGEEHESDARDGNEQHKGAVISAGERARKGSTSTGSTGSNAH